MGQLKACIGITGGPMSGKTSSLVALKNYIEKAFGVGVIIIPESATFLLNANIIPPKITEDMSEEEKTNAMQTLNTFQGGITILQGTMEDFFMKLVESLPGNYVLLLDRTRIDGGGYEDLYFGEKGRERFENNLKDQGYTRDSVLKIYDLVIFLGSYAHLIDFSEKQKGEETIRLEGNAKEALKVEDALLEVYKNCPNVAYIPATENIEDKLEQMKKEVDKVLGNPVKILI